MMCFMQKINRDISRKCKLAKEKWWNNQCDDKERLEAMNRHQEMHDKIKEITGTKRNLNAVNALMRKKEICYSMKTTSRINGRNMYLNYLTMTEMIPMIL